MEIFSRRDLLKYSSIGAIFGVSGCLRLQSNADSESNTDSVINSIELSTGWEQNVSGSITGTGDHFYVSTFGEEQELVKIDLNGDTVFETSGLTDSDTYFNFYSESDPLVVDDTGTYIGVNGTSSGTEGARLIRLDSQTGEQIWSHEEENNFKTVIAPVQLEDLLIYGATNESDISAVRALNIDSGDIVWQFDNFRGRVFQLIESDGELWIQTAQSVTRLDIGTQSAIEEISQINPEYNLQASKSGPNVFIPSDPLTTLEFESGEILWSREGSINLSTNPAVGDRAVFYCTTSGYVRAYEKTSGDRLWETRVDGAVGNPISLDQNSLWVGTSRGFLLAFDAATGDALYKNQIVTGRDANFSFAVLGDMLFDSHRTTAYRIQY